ncbi:MAG: septal ring lytic transglycosylase RlpA family protein [Candidatus Liberibacter ctenarytainae]|uniref:Endolytic peptidoglycan transglycosylase RlpA n=1 Tax=Candidatus Liberibacter ctenarytainae TaxID=2020335 RepID=A0A937AJ45_9HYPH|nr:septal ring lytic transglycosylase RlpA family protein [Candidatus Liberibacter ctenarytainae]
MERFSFVYFTRICIVCIASIGFSSCSTRDKAGVDLNGNEYFPESRYGVSASNRVAFGNKVPKGGGYYLLGKPYQIRDRWYVPREYISYAAVGMASWYGTAFHGRLTANGEVYNTESLTAAHPTLPLPSYVRVTNLENGLSLIVRVNDRGPYHNNRLIDLSSAAARILQIKEKGVAKVHVQYIKKADLGGDDRKYLQSTFQFYQKKMSLPLGCKYRERISNIPFFWTSDRIVFLNNCDEDSLQRERSIASRRGDNSHHIPVPTRNLQHTTRSQRSQKIPVPSRVIEDRK